VLFPDGQEVSFDDDAIGHRVMAGNGSGPPNLERSPSFGDNPSANIDFVPSTALAHISKGRS
jgi:hypothetical protein